MSVATRLVTLAQGHCQNYFRWIESCLLYTGIVTAHHHTVSLTLQLLCRGQFLSCFFVMRPVLNLITNFTLFLCLSVCLCLCQSCQKMKDRNVKSGKAGCSCHVYLMVQFWCEKAEVSGECYVHCGQKTRPSWRCCVSSNIVELFLTRSSVLEAVNIRS